MGRLARTGGLVELKGSLNLRFMVVVLLLLYIANNAKVAVNRIVNFRRDSRRSDTQQVSHRAR